LLAQMRQGKADRQSWLLDITTDIGLHRLGRIWVRAWLRGPSNPLGSRACCHVRAHSDGARSTRRGSEASRVRR
jgi:hypothetical protein